MTIKWAPIRVPGQRPGPLTLRACPDCGDLPRVTWLRAASIRYECRCGVVVVTPDGTFVSRNDARMRAAR